jgi:hypothetical protein
MTRISSHVYLYTPDDTSTATSTNPQVTPQKLILFCSWMGAGAKHIAKYLTRYQTLYPTSQILLIRADPRHMVFPSECLQITAPAVPIIRAALPPSSSSQPQLLVHLFSNAGSSVLSHLYTHFAAAGDVLPLHAAVFDSAPGEGTYSGSVAAFTAAAPAGWMRVAALPFVHLLICLFWLKYIVTPWGKNPLVETARRHNDRSLVKEVRRSYIYSEEDVMIPWRGVERHAAAAREKGFEVRLEKFGGSLHVAHMVADAERYWRIVKATWEGSE